MKLNMHKLDRALRIGLMVLIGILYFTGAISGTPAIILGIVAVIFLVTSLMGFCPLYSLVGISTCKKPD